MSPDKMVEFCFNTFNNSAYFGIDANLPEQIQAASQAGYRYIGPDLFSLEQWQMCHQVDEFARLCNQHGVSCWEIAAGIHVSSPRETILMARKAAHFAGVLKAPWILTTIGSLDRDARRALTQASEIASEVGARLAIEYIPNTAANSVLVARELVQSIGLNRAGILCDVWHHFRGRDSFAELADITLEEIAYVQFSDALPISDGNLDSEMLNRRVFPGEGEFDLTAFCALLQQLEYTGVVSVEVLNANWRAGDLFKFAQAGLDASVRFWENTQA